MRIIAVVMTALLLLGSADSSSSAVYQERRSSSADGRADGRSFRSAAAADADAEDDDSAFVSKTFKALEGDVRAGTDATAAAANEGETDSKSTRAAALV